MKRKLSAAIIATAAIFMWAASAGAVDGVIEINQAKVLAAGGFPYLVSAPGSYRLTGNLSVSGSHDAIDVNVTGVTLDLNGFSISGPGTGAGTSGIKVGVSGSGVTVNNGTITSFFFGLLLGTGATATNIHANGDDVGILTGNNSRIEDSVVISNVENGIDCEGSNCTISGNTANSNLNYGITCSSGGCAISHNTANGNGIAGIACNAAGCVISGNTANGNVGGIVVTGASLVIRNTIENNSGNGFAGAVGDGYGENVMSGNGANTAGVAKSMGNNVCSGALC
jgi:parallel beta-helix repeat protein